MASRLKADAKGDFIDALIGAQQPCFRQAYPLRKNGAVERCARNLPVQLREIDRVIAEMPGNILFSLCSMPTGFMPGRRMAGNFRFPVFRWATGFCRN